MTVTRSKYTSHLTEAEVAEIRAAPFAMRHTDVAARFGVSPTTVARIRKGLTWQEHLHEVVKVRVPKDAFPALEDAAKAQEVGVEELASRIVLDWASGR